VCVGMDISENPRKLFDLGITESKNCWSVTTGNVEKCFFFVLLVKEKSLVVIDYFIPKSLGSLKGNSHNNV